MLKNVDELKTYPFVIDVLQGKITKTKLKLFISNLNEFLKDEDFRKKFGFEKEEYNLKECITLVRYLIKGKMGIEDLLSGVEVFAHYVTEKWPQINETGEINYYFAGSLAIMLLAKTDSMTLLDLRYFPKIKPLEIIVIPKQVKAVLATFARRIGDLDFVRTEVYNEMLKKASAYVDTDVEKYRLLRSKILTKGGGGPTIDELPDLAREIFVSDERRIKVMCDPVETYGDHQPVIIRVRSREYLTAHPIQIFSYKVLHIIQSFDNKTDRLKNDFTILHKAFSQMYLEEELIKAAYTTLVGYQEAMYNSLGLVRKEVQKLYENPNFGYPIKAFFDKIRTYDATRRSIM